MNREGSNGGSRPASADVTGSNDKDMIEEIDPRVQLALGQALKAHYDDLTSAPVPDRFLMLLAELEAKEMAEKS